LVDSHPHSVQRWPGLPGRGVFGMAATLGDPSDIVAQPRGCLGIAGSGWFAVPLTYADLTGLGTI
jgi:hypothetical protein